MRIVHYSAGLLPFVLYNVKLENSGKRCWSAQNWTPHPFPEILTVVGKHHIHISVNAIQEFHLKPYCNPSFLSWLFILPNFQQYGPARHLYSIAQNYTSKWQPYCAMWSFLPRTEEMQNFSASHIFCALMFSSCRIFAIYSCLRLYRSNQLYPIFSCISKNL